MKRKWIVFGAALAVFVIAFVAVAAGHQTPSGQPPLANLNRQSLAQLRQEFNASPDSERVLLLLSPTCPVCVEGSSVVNKVLKQHPAGNIRVLVIWEPILPTDWNRPTSAVLDRLSDRRAIQWWDKQHLIATMLQASLNQQSPDCCKHHGTLWDVIAVYPPGAKWTETLPVPKFFAGPVVRGAPQWNASAL
jgi:hypothetical protein